MRLPAHVRGALAILRGFARDWPGPLQRERLSAWIDHLEHMLLAPIAESWR